MEGNNNEDQGEAAVNQVHDDAYIFQDLENNQLLLLPNPGPQILPAVPEINQNNELVAPENLASETILESSSPLHEANLPPPSEPNYMQLTVAVIILLQPFAAHHSYPGQAVMLPFGLYPGQAVMLPFALYPPQQLVLQVPPPPHVMLVPLINYFPPQPVAIYIFYPGQAMMPHFPAQFEPPPPVTEPVRAQLYHPALPFYLPQQQFVYHPALPPFYPPQQQFMYHPALPPFYPPQQQFVYQVPPSPPFVMLPPPLENEDEAQPPPPPQPQ